VAELATVEAYIAEARALLQDVSVPYRYADSAYVSALNMGVLVAAGMRPDIFISTNGVPPDYSTGAVTFPLQYRPALALYVAGRVLVRDAEPSDAERAAAFMNAFRVTLVGAPKTSGGDK
jgi:hypothetical protein